MGHNRWLLSLAVASAALAVYVATAAPGLTWEHWGADGGDLVTAARTLGVPHPPGFPTYTILAWLATHLPVGSIAYRVNMLSAITGASAVGFACAIAQFVQSPWQTRWLPAAVASLSMAFAPLVWSQATISEVYAPALCFASLALLLAIVWRRCGRNALLWASCLVCGLGLGVHLTLAIALPPAMMMLWPQRRIWLRTGVLAPCIVFFLVGLAAFAYLPAAASHESPVNWGAPSGWARLWWVVTGNPYRSLFLALPTSEAPARLREWASLLQRQLGSGGWLLALLGLVQMLRSDRALGVSSTLWVGATTLFAFFYNSPDSIVYLVPTMIVPALWLSQALTCLLRRAERFGPTAAASITALALLLPASSLAFNREAMDLSQDRKCAIYADQVLQAVDRNAIVLAQDDSPTFVLWYALYAEGQRPDVAVVNTNLLGFDWYRHNLRQIYPQLEVPEPPSADATDHEQVRELITHNYLKHAVFAVDPRNEWIQWFEVAQVNGSPVFRIRPLPRWERVE